MNWIDTKARRKLENVLLFHISGRFDSRYGVKCNALLLFDDLIYDSNRNHFRPASGFQTILAKCCPVNRGVLLD